MFRCLAKRLTHDAFLSYLLSGKAAKGKQEKSTKRKPVLSADFLFGLSDGT